MPPPPGGGPGGTNRAAVVGVVLLVAAVIGVAALIQPWNMGNNRPADTATVIGSTGDSDSGDPSSPDLSAEERSLPDVTTVEVLSKPEVPGGWSEGDRGPLTTTGPRCAEDSGYVGGWGASYLYDGGAHGGVVIQVSRFDSPESARADLDQLTDAGVRSCIEPKLTAELEASIGGGLDFRYTAEYTVAGQGCVEYRDEKWTVHGSDVIKADFTTCLEPYDSGAEETVINQVMSRFDGNV